MKKFKLSVAGIVVVLLHFTSSMLFSYDVRIYNAQIKLNALGYGCGRADGVLGEHTATAIEAFQRNENLPVTGNLNKDTLDKLGIASGQNVSQNHSGARSFVKESGTIVESVGDTLQQHGTHSKTFLGKCSKLAGRIYSSVGGNIVEVTEGKNVGKAGGDFTREAIDAHKDFFQDIRKREVGSPHKEGTKGALKKYSALPKQTNTEIVVKNQALVNRFLSASSVEQRNAAKIIFRDHLGEPEIVQIVNRELLENFHISTRDKQRIDALAWMCKILGASGNHEYFATLKTVSEKSSSRKVRKYALKSLKILNKQMP
jgi:peptidoglycan hydrolase-like protein with peptidoglycan-binding domain